jgi:hypothetical protein
MNLDFGWIGASVILILAVADSFWRLLTPFLQKLKPGEETARTAGS